MLELESYNRVHNPPHHLPTQSPPTGDAGQWDELLSEVPHPHGLILEQVRHGHVFRVHGGHSVPLPGHGLPLAVHVGQEPAGHLLRALVSAPRGVSVRVRACAAILLTTTKAV